MGFADAIRSCLSKYATATGRAARSEYWFFALFQILADAAGGAINTIADTNIIGAVIGLALLLPSVAVSIRRLHDLDRTGYWFLIGLIPVVGWIVLLVWACTRGTPGPNRYGPDPLIAAAPTV